MKLETVILNIRQLKSATERSIADNEDFLSGEIRTVGLRDKVVRRQETLNKVLTLLSNHSDIHIVVCSPHGTKLRKGTKVCSYGDKTTWGYMDDWDDSEGCWRIRLPESKEGFMWWPDDEITILYED